MSRRSGKFRRVLSRLFKERQIYHRSDGVVHFISMSSKTQIALAVIVGGALLWVAYASVNVVFKEQIIVAKERDSRIMETTYSKRLNDAQRAYDDVSELNQIIKQNFDETMADISSRHQLLQNMVERKASIDQGLDALAEGLSEAGGPSGQRPTNGNRVMIDVTPGEPTPRQSRLSAARRQAVEQMERQNKVAAPTGGASEAIKSMNEASADLYTEQMLLLARLEEKAIAERDHLTKVLESAGIPVGSIVTPAKISNTMLAQGGPFIDLTATSEADAQFYFHANRAAAAVDELAGLYTAIKNVPLSSPLIVGRRFTSGFGVRRDPINGKYSRHNGIDFAAPWASPITATADGVVKFAGTRSGFGRCVEINHGNGFITRYAHMNRISVKTGQKVKLHDKVGELGNSGRSTGPHVHYEILYKGKPLNPRRFIEAGRYVFES
ncbi:peptidoglycan DD-metalloendopeptidase family protein [Hyphococcus flavus]|uniref:Peptidoglycan DD-metalloendopeptidase family protein n=1 Tax=Hyphococcus flavus TaxID=1866326 RepID=A0AAE9ZC47_9PROT|nr:peptidoglycan DD-metalloendopeptidase family protein [Hyphococcus flavus]WDI31999.1 peptidoglycan DD-metalloendopeptidase family protein [Hyphococcus flavus]